MYNFLKIKDDNFQTVSILASLVIHLIVFISAVILIRISIEQQTLNAGYVQITSGEFESPVQNSPLPVKTETDEKEETLEEKLPVNEDVYVPEKDLPPISLDKPASTSAARYYSYNNENADTSALNNIYAETTLNVRIKYPAGWNYIDQNRKKKLDGVTFVAADGLYNPPPYVHLAVQDKDIFMESRYKHKLETGNYTAYYNDPEELSGQVSQTFYIRTGDDEDYSIKFIMKGQDAFKALQPTFFGMVKSFKFGNSFF